VGIKAKRKIAGWDDFHLRKSARTILSISLEIALESICKKNRLDDMPEVVVSSFMVNLLYIDVENQF